MKGTPTRPVNVYGMFRAVHELTPGRRYRLRSSAECIEPVARQFAQQRFRNNAAC